MLDLTGSTDFSRPEEGLQAADISMPGTFRVVDSIKNNTQSSPPGVGLRLLTIKDSTILPC